MSSASVSMDVNLTISLMRGQMGAVIEKAVNVAVETVLGEMIRVVGLKFEEIKREMGAKEKENENMRRMLETSQCQMKTMRQYISVLAAKESTQRALQGAGDTSASVGIPFRRSQSSNSTVLASSKNPYPKPRAPQPVPVVAGPSWARQQMMPKDNLTVRSDNNIVDLHLEEGHTVRTSVQKGDNSSPHLVVDNQGLLSETSDPIWGQSTLTSAEQGQSEMSDSSIISETLITEESSKSQNTNTGSYGTPYQKIKQEDGEVEIVSVKDEPAETSSVSRIEFSNVELQQVGETEFGVPLDLPASYQSLHSPGNSSDLAIPGFIGMEPISCKPNASGRSLENKQCTAVEKAIIEAQGQMEWKLNHLTTLIQDLVGNTQNDCEEDEGVLPLTSMEGLDSLEQSLMDKATMHRFVRRLSISGGQTMKKTIWRICNKVFTTNLASQLNWCGRGDKRGLRRTCVGALIIAAAMRNGVLQSPTEAEAEKSIKDYLRYAPGRAAALNRL